MFTSRRFDEETSLYYYRARYYDPWIGRFLQTDPIGYYGGLNLYTYVGNNPLSWIDPLGLCGAKLDGITSEWFPDSIDDIVPFRTTTPAHVRGTIVGNAVAWAGNAIAGSVTGSAGVLAKIPPPDQGYPPSVLSVAVAYVGLAAAAVELQFDVDFQAMSNEFGQAAQNNVRNIQGNWQDMKFKARRFVNRLDDAFTNPNSPLWR